MRIPPSVIVMSLVTAVPFGLAIRDWSHGKDKLGGGPHNDDDDITADDDYSEAQNARVRAMMAEEEARDRARAAERQAEDAKLDHRRAQVAAQMIGAEPGTMGELFAGVKLGASSSDFQPESVRAAIADAGEVLVVSWDLDSTHLNGFTARLKVGDTGCAPLSRALGAWGPGNNNTWEYGKLHQRAVFDQDACTLSFERYVDLDKWLAHGDQSVVPLDIIGQPVAKLKTRIGERLDSDDETELRWHDLGVAGAMSATNLTAEIKNGKIVAVTVDMANIDHPAAEAIAARLTKLLGKKPTPNEDTFEPMWKGRVPVTLASDALTIGTPSP